MSAMAVLSARYLHYKMRDATKLCPRVPITLTACMNLF